jgi:hypothetical protein
METIISTCECLLYETSLSFKRYLYAEIDWSNRLIAIIGARGRKVLSGCLVFFIKLSKPELIDLIFLPSLFVFEI